MNGISKGESQLINKGYLTAKTDKASDEYFTPEFAVLPIIKHLQRFAQKFDRPVTVWCPFDKETSAFVQVLRQYNYKVLATHIDSGYNFFDFEPQQYDIIISNPPFSIKDLILKRLDELGKPYAMLLPLSTLQGVGRFDYIQNCQALIFNKRINFYQDEAQTIMAKGVAFATIYICKNFLNPDGVKWLKRKCRNTATRVSRN